MGAVLTARHPAHMEPPLQISPSSLADPGPAPADGSAAAASGRKVYVETYGCQMNIADTEVVAAILKRAGYRCVESPEEADVILINTCAVRENAEERVIGRASQLSGLRAHNPNLTIGILGCMAQHLAASLPKRAPFVDLVMGPDSYQRLPDILAQTSSEALLDVRLSRVENYVGIDAARKSGTNAWVTIIRGCDKFCTFCIVPYVRGRERSLDPDEVLRQVTQLASEGFREVTLLGQTVNSYHFEQTDFADLLRAVAAVDGIERVRFTSPFPKDFTERAIAAMAELPEVCPALHLPVQSGSDSQLESMRRGYSISEYRDLVARLRAAIPDLSLSSDIIVGFCGESEEDFRQTVRLMEEMRFDSAFMFKYSERSGTAAHRKLPDDVPEELKLKRLQEIIALQEQISFEVNQRWVGKSVRVLVQGNSKRKTAEGVRNRFGRSAHGKVVVFPEEAEANSLRSVLVDRATSHTLYGSAQD